MRWATFDEDRAWSDRRQYREGDEPQCVHDQHLPVATAPNDKLDDTSKRDGAERSARAERGTPVRSRFRCCTLMPSWESFALGCAWAGGLPLWMLVHDDADHEFDYVTRAERCSTQPKRNAGPSSASVTIGPSSSVTNYPEKALCPVPHRHVAARVAVAHVCRLGYNTFVVEEDFHVIDPGPR
jgi:hypothetical protein